MILICLFCTNSRSSFDRIRLFFKLLLKDGNVEPEDFTNQLQKELKSSPQPCLVPFLKVSASLSYCVPLHSAYSLPVVIC